VSEPLVTLSLSFPTDSTLNVLVRFLLSSRYHWNRFRNSRYQVQAFRCRRSAFGT
jgi:hypothetical protein